jgi:beta-lactamase superfamily II metal-dependent hydrolase
MVIDPSRLGIYVLDVGQGDCTFIVPPEGEGDPILFDCADAPTAERFIANHRINRLEAVVASHLDEDHVGGLLPLLKAHFEEGGEVGTFFLSADRAVSRRITKVLAALLNQAETWEKEFAARGFVLAHPVRGNAGALSIASGPDWKVEILLPFQGTHNLAVSAAGAAPNLASAVLRVSRAGTSVLIGGDAPLGSWERLDAANTRAAAIRTPHHGGNILQAGRRWTTYGDLYQAVAADHALISVGTTNGHNHPQPPHVQAARRTGACAVRCTQLTPRCHVAVDAVRGQALTQAGTVEYPYRHLNPGGGPSNATRREVPCVGTMSLAIDARGAIDITPDPADMRSPHAALVDRLASPLCR